MPTRKILVPLSGQYDPADPELLEKPALETAFHLGRRFNAHVEVFCVGARTSEAHEQLAPWMPRLAVEDLLEAIEKENDLRRERALALFDVVADNFSAARVLQPDPQAGFSVNFLEQIGEIAHSLPLHGRLADLIVTACFPLTSMDSVPPLLATALRETGRPLLVSPRVGTESFGKKIAIAWNGSAEAARAVGAAMEFLMTAKEVTIICVNEDELVEPSGDRLAEYLQWHGVTSRSITIDGGAGSVGQILFDQIEEAKADMLVMGAYTRTRLQRVVFGGVTGEVLARMDIPVLMVD